MKKILKIIFFLFLILILLFLGYFFVGTSKPNEKVTFGVNFSQAHAQKLGLSWKEAYLAILEDLKVKEIKLLTQWDLLEPEKGKYQFSDLDWQIQKAKEADANLILVIGMKTGRWPECHLPAWALNLEPEEIQEKVLKLIEKIVLRYQNVENIWAWQVENEPFFPFGKCPFKITPQFLKKEIELVKKLDPKKRPVIVSDSGEGSFWIKAALLGDIVGITLYKTVWIKELGIYFTYPFPPIFYQRKANLTKKIFKKDIICIELQAEPWGPTLLYYLPEEEEEKSMNLEKFLKIVDFAKKTGIEKFYFWGAEWWYQKKLKGKPYFWEEAKKLFS